MPQNALIWTMENMSQHTSCQNFGTDCKDIISMIKDPRAWPSFSTELSEVAANQGRFPNFKIFHVPRTRNKTVDALAKTARGFHRKSSFCWLFYSGLDSQTTSSLSNRTAFRCIKKCLSKINIDSRTSSYIHRQLWSLKYIYNVPHHQIYFYIYIYTLNIQNFVVGPTIFTMSQL